MRMVQQLALRWWGGKERGGTGEGVIFEGILKIITAIFNIYGISSNTSQGAVLKNTDKELGSHCIRHKR